MSAHPDNYEAGPETGSSYAPGLNALPCRLFQTPAPSDCADNNRSDEKERRAYHCNMERSGKTHEHPLLTKLNRS